MNTTLHIQSHKISKSRTKITAYLTSLRFGARLGVAMKHVKNELRKPVNVPVRRPSNPAHGSAWHISFMALLLVASFFMIVFATFSSAHAFTRDQEGNAFELPLGYAAVEKSHVKIGLPSNKLPRETPPNIEEAAFNKMILWKAAESTGRGLIEAAVPKARQRILIQPVNVTRSMSNTERNYTIGFLALLFAFMMWITAKMWREFARNTSVNRKQF